LRGVVFASCAAFAALAGADDGNGRIVLVEEDWELIVGDVDAETVAPQITCTLSPRGDLDGSYATFELNHASVPSFSPGGLNLHTWAGSFRTQSQSNDSAARFQSANETVRWTQVMAIWEGKLVFAIKNGQSQTWGDFGGSGMICSATTNLTSLASYSPDDSVRNSGVGYASNRVQSLKLKQVRRTSDAGVTATDQTVRTVFSR
jgi:hypothetical protein